MAMTTSEEESSIPNSFDNKNGFNPQTGIYHSLVQLNEHQKIPSHPNLDIATYVLSHFPPPDKAEKQVAYIDSTTGRRLTYAQLHRSITSLASGLYHGLGLRKGDVVFILSPNSLLYPIICLAALHIGAIITTANPLNTEREIVKQVRDSRATLAISAPEETHKLLPTRVPILLTAKKDGQLSVEELIENCEYIEIPEAKPTQSDVAAILYSSGTTGTSKGVVLTHSNFISVVTLLKWSVDVTNARKDIFLCFIPIFHIYGLAFFGLGLVCTGNTIVLMKKYDFQEMLEAIEKHKVSNIPAVPSVILGLVKYNGGGRHYDLSSLRRVGSGAAPLSKEVIGKFRMKFPRVELRSGYGLTESCGATTLFSSDEEAEARPASSARLLPCFKAKVVDFETGLALPPYKEGELWLKSPTVMKGYLGNEEATAASFDSEGWLKTGDLCYFDDEGYVYIVDRIKELIKHNGYQVAPAELEAILLGHPHILDAAVIPMEDEAAGQIPVAYVVRADDAKLTEDQVIQFVNNKVAPYKKIRRVSFISAIPRSAAGKILRRDLISQSKHQMFSKL
ncbi:hypothetical protein ABFS82_06G161700 [Erythranthe guttata]|uniref:Uncharacterized protein n=1 Tax=Erythranthe guttata TaxID=4155 RepID=A0A022QYQ5_ERYGU|nr:PREDICTED: 4-coumarate--CoA ligase-like 5 [Erythranthe guttata]EYU32443.1 hypothetical protein MIMGU_mgv1a019706mg [Erythranthe guttata]|eukprot:XP_012843328.1 PREDICTED: 4-coumarate--CoA ligase-like 5 [Erythranthe guttata]